MTYASLEGAASKITAAKEDLDQVITALDSAVSALDGQWSGVSYEAFKSAWSESKPTMEKLSAAVENFSPELTKAVEEQQARETAAAGGMEKLAF